MSKVVAPRWLKNTWRASFFCNSCRTWFIQIIEGKRKGEPSGFYWQLFLLVLGWNVHPCIFVPLSTVTVIDEYDFLYILVFLSLHTNVTLFVRSDKESLDFSSRLFWSLRPFLIIMELKGNWKNTTKKLSPVHSNLDLMSVSGMAYTKSRSTLNLSKCSQGRTNYFQAAVSRLQVNALRAAFSLSESECKRCAVLLALMCC